MSAIHPLTNNFVATIDPNKCLPPELTVESVDDILYRIGLSFDSIRDRPKRKLIDHPLIALSLIVIIFHRKTNHNLSLSEENHLIFRALGSVGYFIGVRQHFDLFFILCSILASHFSTDLLSQLQEWHKTDIS